MGGRPLREAPRLLDPAAFVRLAERQGDMSDSPADADFDPDLFLTELTGLPSYSLGVAFEFRTVVHNSVMASAPGHEVVDARGFVESGVLAGSEATARQGWPATAG